MCVNSREGYVFTFLFQVFPFVGLDKRVCPFLYTCQIIEYMKYTAAVNTFLVQTKYILAIRSDTSFSIIRKFFLSHSNSKHKEC